MNNNYYGYNSENIKMWNPSIEVESSNGVRSVDLLTRLLSERRIFLNGDVTDEMANDFVAEMLHLAQTREPVNIYLNTRGGSVDAGLIIYDVIQACKDRVEINIYCTGMAASMGAVILAGGQKGRRFILPHSRCMIHEPLISGGFGGSASSIKKTSDSILETKNILNGILAKHTGRSLKEIDEATSYDNYLNAKEAVEFGLADAISYVL